MTWKSKFSIKKKNFNLERAAQSKDEINGEGK